MEPFRRLWRHRWVQAVFSHSPELFAKFLSVGVVNTAFAYSLFAVLTYFIGKRYPAYGFVAAGVISAPLNVTFSFLTYKWFVFRTKGNYVREWLKVVAVYGSSALATMLVLPVVVIALRATTPMYQAAPYVGAALMMVVTTLFNFLAHKEFSFKTK